MSAPRVSCVLELVVPTAQDGTAQIRTLATAVVPDGATVIVRCGAATFLNDFDVPHVAERLRAASEVRVHGEDPRLVLDLRAALSRSWRHLEVVR